MEYSSHAYNIYAFQHVEVLSVYLLVPASPSTEHEENMKEGLVLRVLLS